MKRIVKLAKKWKSKALKAVKALKSNWMNISILLTQGYIIWRLELISTQISNLSNNIAQSLVVMYMNMVMIANELAGMINSVGERLS